MAAVTAALRNVTHVLCWFMIGIQSSNRRSSRAAADGTFYRCHGAICYPSVGLPADGALLCPAGRSGFWSRRTGAPEASATDGTGPSVRTGSVTHRDHRGTSGHQRSPAAKRNHRSMSLRLKQQARGQPANQIVVPKVIDRRAELTCQRPGFVDGQRNHPGALTVHEVRLGLVRATCQGDSGRLHRCCCGAARSDAPARTASSAPTARISARCAWWSPSRRQTSLPT
jgi:hypothetical protein